MKISYRRAAARTHAGLILGDGQAARKPPDQGERLAPARPAAAGVMLAQGVVRLLPRLPALLRRVHALLGGRCDPAPEASHEPSEKAGHREDDAHERLQSTFACMLGLETLSDSRRSSRARLRRWASPNGYGQKTRRAPPSEWVLLTKLPVRWL